MDEPLRNWGMVYGELSIMYEEDGDDLCYLGGFPGGCLKGLFGIWNEEIDTLYPEDKNSVDFNGSRYDAFDYCEIIHPDTADVLAEYKNDFYAESPALTVNS